MMNEYCHPQLRMIQGTSRAVRITPTLVPALNIPVAKERSLLGNHSATVLILAGKFPASPKPSINRSVRSEEHTSELQSRENLVCRLLLEKKNKTFMPALV